MKRRLLNLLTGVSLLLCVAVCALWVRSYWVGEALQWVWSYLDEPARQGGLQVRERSVLAARGGVQFHWEEGQYFEWAGPMQPPAFSYVTFERASYPTANAYPFGSQGRWLNTSLGGFEVVARDVASMPPIQGGQSERSVTVPLWLPAALTATPPALWMRAARRRRRHARRGLCRRCGYDLRATPDRCPECGHAAADSS